MSIALKEANETDYWLSLLKDTQYIDERLFASLSADCKEIIAMLVSTVKTMKSEKSWIRDSTTFHFSLITFHLSLPVSEEKGKADGGCQQHTEDDALDHEVTGFAQGRQKTAAGNKRINQ